MDWVDRIGRRIRLRDLHILLAVTECERVKAAAQLSISHPVVSKTISDLEQTLGVGYFSRGPQGVEPTAYGKVLLDCGVTVFDEMRQGLTRIEFLTKTERYRRVAHWLPGGRDCRDHPNNDRGELSERISASALAGRACQYINDAF